MIVTQAINVHLDKQSTPTIETVQSDTGRSVTVALFTGGKAWEPPAGATATVRHSILHNGEFYTSTYDTLRDGRLAVEFSENVLTVHLSPEILSIPGVGELQVGILYNNALVATMSVLLRVQRNIGTQGLQPTAYTDLSHHIQNELVRQFREIYDQGSWLENLHHRVDTDFTPGGFDSEGEFDANRNYCIGSDFIFHGGREVTVSFPAGVKARCLFYDEDFVFRGASSYYSSSFTHHNGLPYFRLEAGYEDDGRIQDPTGLAEQIGIFYPEGFRGHIGALGYSSFRMCNSAGYYRFTRDDLAGLSDAPDIDAGGILQVFPHADTDTVFQLLLTTDGQVWFRRGAVPFQQVTSSGSFTVTCTDDDYPHLHADKTFSQIRAAVDSGMAVQCKYGQMFIPLTADCGSHFAFNYLGKGDGSGDIELLIDINEDDTASVAYSDKYFPTYGQNMTPVRYIRLDQSGETEWYVYEGCNEWLMPCTEGGYATCILMHDDSNLEHHLPLAGVDINDYRFTFRGEFPDEINPNQIKRYTAILTVEDPFDSEGAPTVEVLVEDVAGVPADSDFGNYYTKAETDNAIADAVAGIEIPDGGNAGGEYRLIYELTVDETNQATSFIISKDMEGNDFALSHLFMEANVKASDPVRSDCYLRLLGTGISTFPYVFNVETVEYNHYLSAEIIGNTLLMGCVRLSPGTTYSAYSQTGKNYCSTKGLITGLQFRSGDQQVPYPVGSTVRIYGY